MADRPNRLPDFIEAQKRRAKRDVIQWQGALKQAENVENPNRVRLLDIYDDVMLDAHVTSEIQKRVTSVKGTPYYIVDQDGEKDDERTALIDTPWFLRFLELAIDSVFWGHSLIELGELDEEGRLKDVHLVPRRHVVPEKGLFTIKAGDASGIKYREDPKYKDYLIEVGDTQDLGLLNKATPHVLYKRFGQGAWAEYCEIFGMPVRVGKTNARDEKSRNDMLKMLAEMGTAAYAVIDDDEEIEFLDTPVSKGDIYNGLMVFSNAEISKLINGAVIGEASQGGSRSKEEVGLDIQKMIGLSDLQLLEGYVNHRLIPRLIILGYDLNGFKLEFEQSKDLDSLWKMTKEALDHYDVDEDFIYSTFGIPVRKKANNDSGSVAGFFG